MLAVERRKAILDLIVKDGRAVVTSLSDIFGVTEETVRSDLKELERRGLILRIHGGAVPFDEGLPDLSAEIRETVNSEGKKAIAKIAASYIKKGDVIFFDASTTVYYLAMELKNFTGITIVTNSLRIINELIHNEGIHLICLGGNVLSNNKSLASNSSGNFIRGNFYADKCFISCAGVLSDGSMYEGLEDEVDIKRAMIECSKNLVLLCDKTKLGRVRFSKITTLKKDQLVITDVEESNQIIRAIAQKGVNIVNTKKFKGAKLI